MHDLAAFSVADMAAHYDVLANADRLLGPRGILCISQAFLKGPQLYAADIADGFTGVEGEGQPAFLDVGGNQFGEAWFRYRQTVGDGFSTSFGVHLNKRFQRANWGRRPLPMDMLAYAQLDTHYLIPLRDRLQADLNRSADVVVGVVARWERQFAELPCRLSTSGARRYRRSPRTVPR